jgi:hypothetical protein
MPVPSVRTAADAVAADAIVLAAVLAEPLADAAPALTAIMQTHSVVIGGPATGSGAAALPQPRILRSDVVTAARALTLATPANPPGRDLDEPRSGRSRVPRLALRDNA